MEIRVANINFCIFLIFNPPYCTDFGMGDDLSPNRMEQESNEGIGMICDKNWRSLNKSKNVYKSIKVGSNS